MGTFEIVNTEDIPAGNKVMDMCVSFKIKQDSQGNVTEYEQGSMPMDVNRKRGHTGTPLPRPPNSVVFAPSAL